MALSRFVVRNTVTVNAGTATAGTAGSASTPGTGWSRLWPTTFHAYAQGQDDAGYAGLANYELALVMSRPQAIQVFLTNATQTSAGPGPRARQLPATGAAMLVGKASPRNPAHCAASSAAADT
jgi:hypothetical protein